MGNKGKAQHRAGQASAYVAAKASKRTVLELTSLSAYGRAAAVLLSRNSKASMRWYPCSTSARCQHLAQPCGHAASTGQNVAMAFVRSISSCIGQKE